eukprot:1065318-Pelagomonas_calceolata.AAC.1
MRCTCPLPHALHLYMQVFAYAVQQDPFHALQLSLFPCTHIITIPFMHALKYKFGMAHLGNAVDALFLQADWLGISLNLHNVPLLRTSSIRFIGGDKVPEFWGKKSEYTAGTDFLGTPTDHLEDKTLNCVVQRARALFLLVLCTGHSAGQKAMQPYF